MAEQTTLARPYAKAAFEYALANQLLNEWAAFLRVASQVTLYPGVLALIANPRIDATDLLAFYVDICASVLDTARTNFLKLLQQNQRINVLPQIAELFHHLHTEHDKTLDVDVQSYLPLDENELQSLRRALQKRLQRNVRLQVGVNDELIGGVVIRAGDLVIDGSVKSKLGRLAEQMIH